MEDRLRPWRTATLGLATAALLLLGYMTWLPLPSWVPLFGGMGGPDWSYAPDVTAPLTRKLTFYHPATAWASFAAYIVTFAYGVAYLNERDLRHDRTARAAAGVGFLFNTAALVTGTIWGMQEWSRTGQASLATVYSEPKVLVVLVLWLTFAAYLLLRRLVDGAERRARLSAAFGVLGFLAVPASFLVSRLVQTSLHPDVLGPGANNDAATSAEVNLLLALSAVAFLALLAHLVLARVRLAQLEEALA